MLSSPRLIALIAMIFVAGTRAETHTVSFLNNCGEGTPTLMQNGARFLLEKITQLTVFLIRPSRISTSPVCANGADCTAVVITLSNEIVISPTTTYNVHRFGSSSSLLCRYRIRVRCAPMAKTIQVLTRNSIDRYYNGCDDLGADCLEAGCIEGYQSGDTAIPQIICEDDNADIVITFCD
ncbi:hypothetical protein BT96DRAFT_970278 [Gymnopus androsaceus JB14]|uniref:CUB domain-containing protein n=1 Tax=Gymnopus androsaceus JB14 TaxID=1447944 RepID=A0A6A4IFJ8_9AGAR|nr:hypothetical protein BT96DRAFT_970278 [Gymnopus androsaceus JB14]